MITNWNVLLDMAVDDAKLTGRPLREVIERIIKENNIELLPHQKELFDKICPVSCSGTAPGS